MGRPGGRPPESLGLAPDLSHIAAGDGSAAAAGGVDASGGEATTAAAAATAGTESGPTRGEGGEPATAAASAVGTSAGTSGGSMAELLVRSRDGGEAARGRPLLPLPTTDQGACELGVEQEEGR